MNTLTQLQSLIESIRSQGPELDALAGELRTPAILSAFDKWSYASWCTSVAGDALVRMRLFTEQNFVVIETLGIVAVARYTFEIVIWLRLFALDKRYGLTYFHQLLKTQLRFHQDTLAQMEREIAWLKSLEAREVAFQKQILREAKARSAPSSEIVPMMSSVSRSIDEEADRRFSLYAHSAKTNGYGFQSYLVEQRYLPRACKAVAEIEGELEEFETRVPRDVKKLCPGRWNWRQMALKVGEQDQYDYIYTFASKLLHATPASITTDAKNLEVQEIEIFLRYINITILDLLSLTADYRQQAAAC